MTWNHLHERMAFMAELIDRAGDDPEAALNLNGHLSDVERLFGDEEGLLLSLQHRWVTMLADKLYQAAYDDVPPERAWSELAARYPALRGLLDTAAIRSLRVRSVQRDEQEMLALFGGLPADGAPGTPARQTVA